MAIAFSVESHAWRVCVEVSYPNVTLKGTGGAVARCQQWLEDDWMRDEGGSEVHYRHVAEGYDFYLLGMNERPKRIPKSALN